MQGKTEGEGEASRSSAGGRVVENLLASLRGLPVDSHTSFSHRAHSLGEILDQLVRKGRLDFEQPLQQRIQKNWENLVGPGLSLRCYPECVVGEKSLIVVVENATLRQQLLFQKAKLLAALRSVPGCARIQELVFKLG